MENPKQCDCREFKLLVRHMLIYFNNASPLTLATLSEDQYVKKFVEAKNEVNKKLELFTKEELLSLPFKD